jgi:type II secretory pathway component GspD/PulD (secretin)/tetratricopeptide (TPR) repeat protein
LPLFRNPGRIVAMLVLAGFGLVAAPARAGDEEKALAKAVELFAEGDYLTAQEILVGIDRSKLNKRDQQTRDDYLNRVHVAVTMTEKAMRDLEDAETALVEADEAGPGAAQERAHAVRLLKGILENEYALDSVRAAATFKLRELGALAPEGEAEREGAPKAPVAPPPTVVEPPPTTVETPPVADETPPTVDEGKAAVDTERARALTAEADEMVRAGRYDEAERKYEEALEAVPGYPDAVDGLGAVRAHRENIFGARGDSLIERLKREDAINWQRTEVEYRTLDRAIHDHIANGRFGEARQALDRARQVVESGRQFADPPEKYESLKSEFQALADYLRDEEHRYNDRKVAESRAEIENLRKQRLLEVEENRRRRVESLMEQALQHRKDGDLDAAISVLKQVTVIDPKNDPARWLMDEWDEARQYKRQRAALKEKGKQTVEVLTDVEEAKIPWHEALNYPKDWLEIISRPERSKPGYTPSDSLLFGALQRSIQPAFDRVPFGEVMERLADAHQLNILVNWNDLQRAGIERSVPIDLRLPNEITLKKAITEVLDQAGGGAVELGYDVADGVITIATQKLIDQNTYPVVYDVNDLLMEIPNFTDAPVTDLDKLNARNRSLLTSVDRPFMYGDDDDDEPEYDPDRENRVRKIIDLIQETVAPESWRDFGGSVGTIKEINGQLVVTQNSATQRQIGDLLGRLREQRAIQIGVEARFLTISSHYLEEMGMDLNVVLNSGNAGYDMRPTGVGEDPIGVDPVYGNRLLLPRSFSRLGFSPTVPANLGTANQLPGNVPINAPLQPYGNPAYVPARTGGIGSEATPVPFISNVTSFTNPASFAHDISGTYAGQTIGPALSIFGSFLDNIQVDFLIRATQADQRNSVLTAPRLVLFNGQRSWVAVTVQTNFISQLVPTVNVGAAAQAPQPGTINAGAVLDVQATVTADRRYVTMTLRPGVTRLNNLTMFQTSGGGTAGDAFIQLPELSAQLIKTTVSVPDGGTLLIGGQKLAAETEVDAGVPVLSKIPFLKRAYSSRALIKDEQTLLILIKPSVFIPSEQEELAFPSFGTG